MRISDWSSDVCSSDLTSQSASTGSPAAPGLVQYPCQPDSGFILIASVTDSPGLGVRDSKASDASIWRSWADAGARAMRSEEHTSELQSLMRISYAVFCLKKKKKHTNPYNYKYSHIIHILHI